MPRARSQLESAQPDAVLAQLCTELGLLLRFLGSLGEAADVLEQALMTAAELDLLGLRARALTFKGLPLADVGRLREALAHLGLAVDLAQESGVTRHEAIARINLAWAAAIDDCPDAEAKVQACLALVRRIGDRDGEGIDLGNLALLLYLLGRWEEAKQAARRRSSRRLMTDECGHPPPVGCCEADIARVRGQPSGRGYERRRVSGRRRRPAACRASVVDYPDRAQAGNYADVLPGSPD